MDNYKKSDGENTSYTNLVLYAVCVLQPRVLYFQIFIKTLSWQDNKIQPVENEKQQWWKFKLISK